MREKIMDLKLWKDDGLFDKVYAEMYRAIDKHGFNQTPANPEMNPMEKAVILFEEVGEVARATTYDGSNKDNLKEELIQVAAMALMFASSLEE
jgi:NTP pyrophosphatase (non-canonical NTP hydrolase)